MRQCGEKRNTLLRFHFHTGYAIAPQCYVILPLPVILHSVRLSTNVSFPTLTLFGNLMKGTQTNMLK
jgi:hypothetical protein